MNSLAVWAFGRGGVDLLVFAKKNRRIKLNYKQ
jgi:hypothetical protein